MAINKIEWPSDVPRIETGPLQFGRDWPGLFVRGDEAIGLASQIDAAQCADMLPCNGPGALLLQRVIDLLNSCAVKSNG